MKCEYSVIITGAGSGTRYGGRNKLLELLAGMPVFMHSVKNLSGFAAKENFILTVNEAERVFFESELVKYGYAGKITVINGGASRIESVKKAVEAIKLTSGRVAIHDAARPLADGKLLEKLFTDARVNVIAAQKVVDSIKVCGPDGKITGEIDRNPLWRAETPQVFDLEQYRQAMQNAPADATDDAMIMRHAGFEVYTVKEERENLKLTTPDDLIKLEKFFTL